MKRAGPHPHSRLSWDAARAFTLMELLVVIGLIAGLTAFAGAALGGRAHEGAALAGAQNLLASLAGAARAEAVLHQTSARLLVYASSPPVGDAQKYLRYVQVVRLDGAAWIAVGEPARLPDPVRVVPPSSVPVIAGLRWPSGSANSPVSSFSGVPLTGFSLRGRTAAPDRLFGGVGGGRAYFLQFEADGTVAPGASGLPIKIALAPAVLVPALPPLFKTAAAVRGIVIRPSGAVSLVDAAERF